MGWIFYITTDITLTATTTTTIAVAASAAAAMVVVMNDIVVIGRWRANHNKTMAKIDHIDIIGKYQTKNTKQTNG